jgi:site-specific DNA recombinase
MNLCGAYCRYSHDDGDDSESVKLQVERSRETADRNGWTLDPKYIFADDGYSGREMKRRPDFLRCLEAVSRRAFPILITRDLDRFARGEPFHVATALQQLIDHDVRMFEYLKNGGRGEFLKTEGENAIMVVVRAYSNRQEAVKAGEKIKDKLLARDEANDGWTGLAPFGFKNLRKHRKTGEVGLFLDRKDTIGVLAKDPDEYPVLLLIGELFLKYGTYNAVAHELNNRKIPSPDRGVWESRTVSKILSNEVYRGKVVRGRKMSLDKGGTITVVSAPPDAVRVYDRPELCVWSPEILTEIDAMIVSRKRTTTWSPRERKHLSSSCVRCSYCGSSVAVVKGGKQKYPSYCCTRSRAGTCRELGYRPEHKVDEAVLLACGMLLTDDVLAKTKQIIRETLDVKRQIDARALELDRLTRDIAGSEKKILNYTSAIGDADDAGVRAHLLAVLADERRRLADLKDALARMQATRAPADEKTVLEQLEARVDELRAGLAKGGVAALPTVQSLLGDARLDATRRADGRWDLNGEGHPIRVLHGDSSFVKAGTKQKKGVKGTITTIVASTPTTAPAPVATSPVAATPATAPGSGAAPHAT